MHFAQEDVDHLWVKVFTTLFLDIFQNFFVFPARPVWTVGAQRIPNVHNREYARRQRDLFTFQAARVARAVPFFMVAVGDVQRRTADK